MRSILPAVAVLLAAQTYAIAADPATGWKGVKVLPKWDAVVKVGNETIEDQQHAKFSLPWIVQEVNGEWLWVGDHKKGWVQQSQVVTLDEAPAYYTRLITRNKDRAWAFNLRAVAWRRKGELDLAIADYGELLRLSPDAITYTNRGNVWSDKKDYDKAIADYGQAIRLDPNYALAYNGLGSAWFDKKDYDKAIADFNQAIRLNPDSTMAYSNRGNAWSNKKNDDNAVSDYSEAIRLDPNDADAYNNRGFSWKRKMEYEKAIADYNHAIRLNPNHAHAAGNLGWLMATCPDARFRNGKKAIALAATACELTGWSNAAGVDTLAAAYAEAGDFDTAIKYENKALDLNLTDAEFVKGAKERLTLYEDHKPYRKE